MKEFPKAWIPFRGIMHVSRILSSSKWKMMNRSSTEQYDRKEIKK